MGVRCGASRRTLTGSYLIPRISCQTEVQMTKERLQDLPSDALQEIANRIDISFYPNIERKSLIEQILEVFEEETLIELKKSWLNS